MFTGRVDSSAVERVRTTQILVDVAACRSIQRAVSSAAVDLLFRGAADMTVVERTHMTQIHRDAATELCSIRQLMNAAEE